MPDHRIALRRAVEAVDHLTDPEPPWRDILGTARDLVGADSGTLIVFDARNKLLTLSAIGFSDACASDYQAHFYSCDILEQDGRHAPAGTWLDTARMYDAAQLHRTEFYADFMVRHRMTQLLSLIIESNTVLHAAIGFQRSSVDAKAGDRLQSGDFGRYFRVLRHQLSQRERNRAIGWKSLESAFSEVHEAVLLISVDCIVDKLSPLAVGFLDDVNGWTLHGRRLRHADAKVQRLFDAHCAAVARDGQMRSMATASGWGELFWVDISAAPPALSLIGGRMLLMRMRKKSAFAMPDVTKLQSVFSITHAEAAVLAGLAGGHSVGEVATPRQASVAQGRRGVLNLEYVVCTHAVLR